MQTIKSSKKLTKYMQMKKEVKARAPQLKKDVDAIRSLLRDKYGFGARADEFSITETAVKGSSGGRGTWGSFHSTQDRINIRTTHPEVTDTVTDTNRLSYVTTLGGGYFMAALTSRRYKARALSPDGIVITSIKECREFLNDIKEINPKYVGE